LHNHVNLATVIDNQRVGALQVRAFLLCAAVLFVDGFDIQGITYVAPAISQAWALPRGAFGPTFSAGLVGMTLGGLLLAPLADRIGRRRVIIASCIAFGLFTTATTLMHSLGTLLVLRFFTGLGLGSALPNAIGLASEYAPHNRRGSVVMFVSSGVSLGSIAAGLIAARLISTIGWQAVFAVGGVLPLLLAAVLWRWLPESIRFAALLPSRHDDAKRLLREIAPQLPPDHEIELESVAPDSTASVRDLFRNKLGRSTALIWIAFFTSLLNLFLAVNWLPTSLHASGFTVTQAAMITSMYHVGGVVGTFGCGLLMDRFGAHRILIFAFILAGVGFYTFAMTPVLPQWTTTLLLMATGFGVIATQVGMLTLASMVYPVQIRSTGLGWALGIGRVGSIIGPAVGGVMLTTGFDARHLYLFCIVPALIGAIAIALLRGPRPHRTAGARGLTLRRPCDSMSHRHRGSAGQPDERASE
jgi:MFS transporter, AAHS family, 4-hydroxybenzoate transporter